MSRTLAKVAVTALTCVVLAGCNTANVPLASEDDESTGPARCPSGAIFGAGSEVQRNAIEDVRGAYGDRCENKAIVGYDLMDAETSLAQFAENKRDWIGFNGPLDPTTRAAVSARCAPNHLVAVPVVATPIALVHNVDGVDKLVLSGTVAAKIFDGTITEWDHPYIAGLNPGVHLPAAKITVFGRSDASGLTEQISRYLADVGGWPQEKVSRQWPGVGEPTALSPGMVESVRSTPNSIGYVELSVAQDNHLPTVWLDSGTGPVEAGAEGAAKALAEAQVETVDGAVQVGLTYAAAAEGAYPMISIGYAVTCSGGLDKGKAPLLRDVLGFMVSEPQQQTLGQIGEVPLSEPIRSQAAEQIKKIR